MTLIVFLAFFSVCLCIYFVMTTIVKDSTGYIYKLLSELSEDINIIKEKLGIKKEPKIELSGKSKFTSTGILILVKHLILFIALLILLYLLLQVWR